MRNLKRVISSSAVVAFVTAFGVVLMGQVMAASVSGGNFTTNSGGSWDAVTSFAGSYAWTDMAASADGTKMIASENNSVSDNFPSEGKLWRSTNSGASWTVLSNSSAETWTGVASSADGTKLVATETSSNGTDGKVWLSTDSGATWAASTAPNKNWQEVASSADGTKLVAVPCCGTNAPWTSTDSGATWTQQSTSGFIAARSVASSADGTKLAIGGSFGDVWTSTDSGVNWTERDSATTGMTAAIYDIDISDNGSTILASGYDAVARSVNSGSAWTVVTPGVSANGYRGVVLSADGTKAALTNNSTSTGAVFLSTNSGGTWTEQTGLGHASWQVVAMSDNGVTIASLYQAPGGPGPSPGPDPGPTPGPDTSGIPNNGDANGDGLLDSTQPYVKGKTDPVTGQYALMQAGAIGTSCTVPSYDVLAASNMSAQDSGYTYPGGLMDFTIQSCGSPGYTTTVIQYYYGVNVSGLVLRKYNPNTKTYTTITDATIQQVTIGGLTVAKATYNVTDGGPLDMDGQVNGVIVDPAGLALTSLPPSTGHGSLSRPTYIVTTIAGIAAIAAGGVALRRKAGAL